MINIIKADMYRMVRNVGLYIAAAILLFMIGMSIYSISPGSVGMANIGDISTVHTLEEGDRAEVVDLRDISLKDYRKIMINSEGYALDKDILTANMNLYYIFIFITAIIITLEFSGGCIKNTLSSAISRNKYFVSKAIVVFGLCIFTFFLNTYLVYFSNLIFNGKNLSSDLWTVTKATLVQLPPALALISILFGIAFMTKKTAAYNMVTIPFIVVFQLLFNLATKLFDIPVKYYYYELQLMFGKLLDNPSKSYMMQSYGVCAVIAVLFITAGWLCFRKAEIK